MVSDKNDSIQREAYKALSGFLDGFAQLESVEYIDESEKGKIRFGVEPFTRVQIILTEKK